MKLIVIIITVLVSGLFMQINETNKGQLLKFDVELGADTINKNSKNITITLKIENITSDVIKIRNPQHWSNAIPNIKFNGKDIPLPMITINPENLNDFIMINAKETYIVNFDYNLEQLVNLQYLKTGTYEMTFRLRHEVQGVSSTKKFYKK